MKNNDKSLLKGKFDLIFIVGLFLISFIAWFMHTISIQDKPVEYRIKTFADEPQTISFLVPPPEGLKVQGRIGLTHIEWNEKGQVRIAESACQNKTCVKMGWVNNSSILCVPNAVLVELIVKQNSEFDAVSQ